jgi:hypothetical protein
MAQEQAQAQQDFSDIRALVLGGSVQPKQQALYVERLGGWLNIRELYGDERARVLQDAVVQKTGAVNLGILYAGLVVQSLRYPHPDAAPSEPVAPDPLPENASPDEEKAYEEAMSAYRQALADYQHPYPMAHPHAGEKVFKAADRDAMHAALPGQIEEQIAQPAFALSGFKKEDVAEKKASLNATVIDGTATTLPLSSDEPTLSASAESLPVENSIAG